MRAVILLHGEAGTFKSVIANLMEDSTEVSDLYEATTESLRDSKRIIFTTNLSSVNLQNIRESLKETAKRTDRRFIELKTIS